jgi:fumarylacetoacetase
MLELTGEENPIKLNDGTERKFINDNDTVIMKGFCQNGQVRIGFGEVSSKLYPFVRK